MSKKKNKKTDIGELVEAQAKGKKVTRAKTEERPREDGELDVRVSKFTKYTYC